MNVEESIEDQKVKLPTVRACAYHICWSTVVSESVEEDTDEFGFFMF